MALTKEDKERMLAAWLRVTASVAQVQQFQELRYNEAVICNILMKNEVENPGHKLTATDLCNESHMLKSQMNRTLSSMEAKGIIKRERSDVDRRRVFTTLRPGSNIYERQHAVGEDDADKIVAMLNAISEAAEQVARESDEC